MSGENSSDGKDKIFIRPPLSHGTLFEVLKSLGVSTQFEAIANGSLVSDENHRDHSEIILGQAWLKRNNTSIEAMAQHVATELGESYQVNVNPLIRTPGESPDIT